MKTGITGGIGSGKSYVCKLLAEHAIEVYDSDSAAKRLMCQSATLRRQLTKLIGPTAYFKVESGKCLENDGWCLNKAVVAQFLLSTEENAHAIDTIVHPAVFRDFEESGKEWLESALLFESGMYRMVDRVIVVTAPEEVRISRVMQRDGISREKAKEWIARQWPQEELIRRSDIEIINDGHHDLRQQIAEILNKT